MALNIGHDRRSAHEKRKAFQDVMLDDKTFRSMATENYGEFNTVTSSEARGHLADRSNTQPS